MRLRAAVANGLLIVLATCVGFGLAEVGLRALYPQELGVWYSLRNGMVIHPPGTKVYLARFGREVQFNSWGMRDVDHPEAKGAGTFRILLLGDSFMEALQVGLEESFPRLLEAELRERTGRHVEVINCAVSGWGTDDELEYLTRFGVRLKPDLILIAMTLHNDVSDNLEEQFYVLRDGVAVKRTDPEMPWGEFRLLKVKDYLASRSHLTQLLRKYRYLRQVREGAEKLDSHLEQLVRQEESAAVAQGWELTRALLLRIREEGAAINAKTAVFLIPLSIQLYEARVRVFLERHELTRGNLSLDRPQEIMRRFGARSGMPVIDLLPEFRGRLRENGGTMHVADGHWHREGHRLGATVVAGELIRQELLASTPVPQ